MMSNMYLRLRCLKQYSEIITTFISTYAAVRGLREVDDVYHL